MYRELRCSGLALEALGRLALTDGNEGALCFLAIREPSLLTAVTSALAIADQPNWGVDGRANPAVTSADDSHLLLPPTLLIESAL